MSIEAMKRALDVLVALDTLFSPVARDSTQRVWIHEAKESIEALRTAIQQAEAKTDEMDPLSVKGALSGIVDAQVRDLWPTKSATHPAPSVPDAVDPPVEDGTEYDYCSGRAAGYAEGWNACRDEMLTTIQAQKGQP